MSRAVVRRPKLAFSRVNVKGDPGYRPDVQRHHLLPRQILGTKSLARMLSQLGREQIGFDDFRRNGLLLPSSVAAVQCTGLPLHCGPHREYNALVMERVGQIEAKWSRDSDADPQIARCEAIFRLELLQRALRQRLLDAGRERLWLSRKDPFRPGPDFAELDAMVDQLWSATAPGEEGSS